MFSEKQIESSSRSAWFGLAVSGVFAITLVRVVLLAFNSTDLFVDEAQYWLWGQSLDFGYYSKPPMIGWVIRLFTEIGSDAAFWVRLPGPLFHGLTALILGAIAAQLFDRRAALVVALGYVTLPMVAVGSLLVSTDTIMFPFLAGSLLFYIRLIRDGGPGFAVSCGLLLGLAFLSKYAAIYYILCAVIVSPLVRPRMREALIVLAAFLVAASPNLIWNFLNGLTTVQHTLDNADWVRDPSARAGLNWASLGEFFAAQFAVFGPILFGGLLVLTARWRHLPPKIRLLLFFTMPVILIVCVQALLSGAYANWAAAAYLAGSLAVLPWLTRPWLIVSFAINGFLCLLFPLATTAPELLVRDGQPLLNRYLGRHEMTAKIVATAKETGISTIVASDRDILADLFYEARGEDLTMRSIPTRGRAPHHYALAYPYEPKSEDILLVLRKSEIPFCASAISIRNIAPDTGAFRRHPVTLYRVNGLCLQL